VLCDSLKRLDGDINVTLIHRNHVNDDLRREFLKRRAEPGKFSPIAVDVLRAIVTSSGLSAVKSRYLVTRLQKVTHDVRTHERCSANNEDSHYFNFPIISRP
jgi:hypothetical protein